MAATAVEPRKGYELKIVRTFDAPRELVWKAWTDPEMAKQWAGPRGFTSKEYRTGTKVGDTWHMSMEGNIPGTEQLACLSQGGKILEIDPPRLLKYTFAWNNRASVGLEEGPYPESVVTVELEEQGRKTVMTFTQGPFATESERNGHNGGWNSAFDKFAEFMLAQQPYREPDPNDVPTELHLKRFFKAPRSLVFDAWTRPEMVSQWWGPKGFTCPCCEWDAKQGGEIYVEMKAPDGTIYPMTGKFIEVYPPYRFHFTATAPDRDGIPIFENWNSVFFEEVEGGTMVTLDVHVMMQTTAAPQYLKGMTAGWTSSLEKLKEMLEVQEVGNRK